MIIPVLYLIYPDIYVFYDVMDISILYFYNRYIEFLLSTIHRHPHFPNFPFQICNFLLALLYASHYFQATIVCSFEYNLTQPIIILQQHITLAMFKLTAAYCASLIITIIHNPYVILVASFR